MDKQIVIALFEQFKKEYDFDKFATIWENQRQIFKDFWINKILKNDIELFVPADTNPIIRLLDLRARGRQKTDESVGKIGLNGGQNRWEDLFSNLKAKKEYKELLDEIFQTADDEQLIPLINRLKNLKIRDLTGAGGNMLNALQFVNKPSKFISVVSLNHRNKIMETFDLGNLNQYKTYGEQIIRSNADIIIGFREKYRIDTTPRALSVFLYTPGGYGKYTTNIKTLWLR